MDIQWPLVFFTLFASMGSCLFVFVGINEFTKNSEASGFVPGLIAGILAIFGGICSVFHLEHAERIMNALTNPSSGIFAEAVLIGCLVLSIAIYLICLKRDVRIGIKAFAVLGIIFGIALAFMTGRSYTAASIAAWSTNLLPVGYLLTALPMGSSLYWALACKTEKAGKFMAMATLICGALGLVGTLAYAAEVNAFIGHSLMVVIAGLSLSGVIPIALGVFGLMVPKRICGCLAFISAATGALCFRILTWTLPVMTFGFFGQNF